MAARTRPAQQQVEKLAQENDFLRRRLEATSVIERAILAAQEPADIACTALDHMLNLLPECTTACVLLFTPAGGLNVLAARPEHSRTSWAHHTRYALTELGLSIAGLQAGRPSLVNNLDMSAGLSPLQLDLLDRGIRAYSVFPLSVNGELIGTLHLAGNQPDVFRPEQVRIAQEVTDLLAVAVFQTRILKAERQRRQEAEVMRDLMAALANSLEINQVLKEIFQHLEKVIHYDLAALFLLDESGRLVPAEDVTKPEHLRRLLNVDNPITSEMWRTRRPVIVPDAQVDPRLQGWPDMDFVRGWMGVPLFAENEMIGFLTLGGLEVGAYRQADAALFEVIAAELAEVLNKARKYERTNRRAEEMEVISTISSALYNAESQGNVLSTLVDQSTRIFGASLGAFLALEREPRQLVVRYSQDPTLVGETIPEDGGPLWEAVRERQPVFIPNTSEDSWSNSTEVLQARLWGGIHSAAVVPLTAPDAVLGVLHYGYKNQRDFLPEDRRLFGAISETAVTAIRGAMVFDTLEQEVVTRTRHLTTMYDISAITSESVELRDILERALQITLEAMGGRSGAIHLLEPSRRRLLLVAQRDLRPALQPALAHLSLRSPFWKNLLQSSGPLIYPNLAEVDSPLRGKKGAGLRALIGAPIRARGQPLGLLTIFSDSVLDYSIGDINLFMTIADHLGNVVERERLFKKAEQAAVTEERQRLARELHDSVTQMLYSLVLYCGAGRKALKQADLVLIEQFLERIDATAQQALKEMRLLVYELRPSVFQNEGLVGALQYRLDAVEKRLGMNVQFQVDGKIVLAEAVEFDLYRIAEEALNNALKHAKATAISIHIRVENDQVEMEISDNGVGFNPDERRKSGGMGLANMHERAARMGARLRFFSSPGQGSRVRVTVKN